MRPLRLSGALIVAATGACSSGNTGFGDAGGGSDAAMDVASEAAEKDAAQEAPGDDGGGACNSLPNAAPMVSVQNVAMAAPTPLGGTLIDGKYFLTVAKVYTGPNGMSGATGASYQWTTSVTGQAYESNVTSTGPGAMSADTSGTLMTGGATIIIEQSCPLPNKSPFNQFDSDGTTVTLYYTNGSQTQALTFTKQ